MKRGKTDMLYLPVGVTPQLWLSKSVKIDTNKTKTKINPKLYLKVKE